MATTEIEKLERRYAENPQGLTFAPLAEIHRKNGDVARALELLRAGLELHPNYIPASIVLGRCQWDAGDLPAAEAAFSHVLRLDDENVIALKSLADINERLERFSEAQRWLNRLISVDRSNEEARQQLARIEAARKQPSPPPAVPDEIAAAEPKPVEEPKEVRDETPAAEVRPPIAEPVLVPADQPAGDDIEPKAPALEFLDTSEPVRQAAQPESSLPADASPPEDQAPVSGLISQEFVPPKDTTYRLHPELTHEFVAASEAPDNIEFETAEEVELHSSGAAEFRVPNAAEDFMELSGRSSTVPVAEPEPAPRDPVPEPRRASYSVRDTKGQSVAAFFKAMLSARPPAGSGSPASARTISSEAQLPPSRAQDQTSSSRGEEALPVAPAAAASGSPQDAPVSFDEFFGSAAAGSTPLTKGSSDPGKDDLDQFQSWLQNLKR
jgi:hypothetical protein